MTAPNIYHYSPHTGELTGMGFPDPDPLILGNWLFPQYCTEVVPPDVPAGSVAVWQRGAWKVLEDHRGETYWLDGEKVVIEELGKLKPGMTNVGPPEAPEGYAVVWEGGTWVAKVDHRGETWFADHNQPVDIDFLGDPADRGLLRENPPSEEEVPEEPDETVLPDLMILLPRREFRRALLHNGYGDQFIEQAIATIEDPVERADAEIFWQDTQHFERYFPLVVTLSQAAGLTEEQTDTLWKYGVSLLNGE